jgi:alpha-L-rhamnosidase
MIPTNLQCEYLTNPLGIDCPRPRLSWALESGRRGDTQSAYQVQVASSVERLRRGRPDLWDSGKVTSSQSLGIAYDGQPLGTGARAWWRVRVWDGAGKVSRYSPPAWWEMALTAPTEWRARWIADSRPEPQSDAERFGDNPAPLFRREFSLGKEIRRARAYVTGLGYYELYLNGQKVGDQVLDPGWTTYSRRVLYATHDVTTLLRRGANAVGLLAGNGWYNPLPLRLWGRINLREYLPVGPPRVLLQLEVEYADGTRERLVTDEHWRVGDSPILRNSLYLGEVYDARQEQPGWAQPGFDDSAWRPARIATEPVGPLQAQTAPPIRATETLRPVAVSEPQPGVFIFDLGQNFAGWVTLRVRGPAGTRIQLRYGELLAPDGTLNPLTSVCGQIKRQEAPPGSGEPATAWQSDTYVLRGDGLEHYTPRFTWHAFRYVEVSGFPGTPTRDALEGHRLHSAVESVGSFACSNELLNRVQTVTRRTLLSNVFSVQSDCPHRERFGYGGDIVAASEMALLNFDMAQFYAKTVRDFADAQRENGGFTETAPLVGIADAGFGGDSGPIGWGTAHPLLLWQLYQYYGNRALLAEQYDAARRWLALLEANAPEHLIDAGIGDHESLVPKETAVSGTAFYYYNAHLMAKIARALDRAADAERYANLAAAIREAFCRRFLDPETGRIGTGTQANQAFALAYDLVPPPQRERVLAYLVRDILEERGGHLTTGIFGTKHLLHALTACGRGDVAYTVASKKTFPSWGYMLEHGATTLWETWAFSDNTFSHNHPMFGSVSEWFFKALAGIQPHPDAVGFDQVIVRPQVVGDLTWAKGSYRSVRGPITSEWRREGETLLLDVSLPPNTTGTVYLPTTDPDAVSEGGRPAAEAEGVTFVGHAEGECLYRIGGGTYHFVVTGLRP